MASFCSKEVEEESCESCLGGYSIPGKRRESVVSFDLSKTTEENLSGNHLQKIRCLSKNLDDTWLLKFFVLSSLSYCCLSVQSAES